MGHSEDRWTIPNPDGPGRIKGPRYGRGSRWLAVWNEPDGQRRKQACATKAEAEAVVQDHESSKRSGTYISPAAARVTVSELAQEWFREQAHQRPSSRATIRRRLDNTILPTLGTYPVADVDRGVIQGAVTTWSRDLAPSTVKVAYVYTAGIFALAVEQRRIATSPCRRINLPPTDTDPITPLPAATVQALIDGLWTPYQPMAVFAAASGLRSGELRGLTWDRITIQPDGSAQVRVDRQLTGGSAHHPTWGPLKTRASNRQIGVGPATVQALGTPGEGLVFRGARGGAINRERASDAWRHAARPLGLQPGSGWHELRHFHASLLIARGLSPVAVAARLGHKNSIETLRTYAHLWPDDDTRMRDTGDGIVTLRPPHGPQAGEAAGQ